MAKRVTPWNPNTADWLVKQRGQRTQDQVVADLAQRGVAVKRAWLSRIENGAPFGAALLEAFQDYYGSAPPTPEPSAESGDGISSDSAALIAAIRSLVEEMRLSRAQQDESTRALLEAVAAVVPSDRGQPGTSGDTGHEARAGTGR